MIKYFNITSLLFIFICTIVVTNRLHAAVKASTENECITVGGNHVGVACKFPFVYNVFDDIPYVPATLIRWFSTEQRFENCTDYRKKSGRNWCATKTTTNNRYIPGYWGECPDSNACSAIEGSWQSWSTWSEWGECVGITAWCGNIGLSHRTRKRYIFTRKRDSEIDGNHKTNEEVQEDEMACMTRECPGWTNRTCRGGDNIFKNSETHLISLLGDTQENCKALCDALPECNLVQFHSGSYRKFYKCIPKSNFNGKCNMYSSSRSSILSQQFYIKPNTEESDQTNLNDSSNWRWNALDDGLNNDCRLCAQSRGPKIWNSCHNECKDIPGDLEDMKLFMRLALGKHGSSSWWSSDEKSRNRTLKLFKDNKAYYTFAPDFDD